MNVGARIRSEIKMVELHKKHHQFWKTNKDDGDDDFRIVFEYAFLKFSHDYELAIRSMPEWVTDWFIGLSDSHLDDSARGFLLVQSIIDDTDVFSMFFETMCRRRDWWDLCKHMFTRSFAVYIQEESEGYHPIAFLWAEHIQRFFHDGPYVYSEGSSNEYYASKHNVFGSPSPYLAFRAECCIRFLCDHSMMGGDALQSRIDKHSKDKQETEWDSLETIVKDLEAACERLSAFSN